MSSRGASTPEALSGHARPPQAAGALGSGDRGAPGWSPARASPRSADTCAMTSGRSAVAGRRTRSSDIPAARSAATLRWQCSRVPTRPDAARAAAANSGSPSRRACASVSVRPGDAGRYTAARPANEPSRSMSSSRPAAPKTGRPPAAVIALAEETSRASAEISCVPGVDARSAAICSAGTDPPTFGLTQMAAPPAGGVVATSITQPTRMPLLAAAEGHDSPGCSHTASQPARATSPGIGGIVVELRGAMRPRSSGWAAPGGITAILTPTFSHWRRIRA
jgi:hypothetical protein